MVLVTAILLLPSGQWRSYTEKWTLHYVRGFQQWICKLTHQEDPENSKCAASPSSEDRFSGEGSGTPARPLLRGTWDVALSGWMWWGEAVQVPDTVYPAAVGLAFRS